MEPEAPLPFSQEPVICPYPKSDESSTHFYSLVYTLLICHARYISSPSHPLI